MFLELLTRRLMVIVYVIKEKYVVSTIVIPDPSLLEKAIASLSMKCEHTKLHKDGNKVIYETKTLKPLHYPFHNAIRKL